MSGLVHFRESNDYCVLKSTQVHEGHFVVGKTISILYKAKLLYAKSPCNRDCEKLLNNKECRKHLSTDSHDSLEFNRVLESERSSGNASACIQQTFSDLSSDAIFNAIDQSATFLHSHMDNICDELC
ncbi:hypothetical protein Y032_0097g2993 [Ancylostoma ceylanicum]|uniref:Uncharacterized protein n=1 Tax=Ancylostoma ceylanicum TaxID=53326 RepID=A0A016TIR2_9BILA|nr:hypothetical protein Y032_0097g2993 [Ancylostoma ceylanicum]